MHWGRFGAVGLLAYAGPEAEPGAPADGVRVLLARRSRWGQHGGTWGPPGGARDSDEPPVAAALREAAEECGLPPGGVDVQGMLRDDHGGWSYQTYVAAASALFPVRAASPEITAARWVDVTRVPSLRLHPGFAASWPVLAQALTPVSVIVDAANVMGARPDGWWRDRAAAALRLHGQLASLAGRGVAGLPGLPGLPPLDRWFPDLVLVVEGAARRAAFPSSDHVRVVPAPGSGDDAIVAEARALPGRRLVVTADRELRRRCEAAGASVTGPGWLLALL
jgi:8-oxo-dGTP pyrophosphatase MutT (NUDIX family)